MKIQIIQVPYDCGHKNLRQGLGPAHLCEQNLEKVLEADGHKVEITQIDSKSTFTMEVGTAFELNRLLSNEVRTAVEDGFFPMVLSGNCNSCLGTIAGIGSENAGIIWFDAHGEFNTPETTLSGFLDGMPLAMATGRCWSALLKTIPGFTPVPEANVVLVGARDLDFEERRLLEHSQVNLVRTADVNDAEIRQGIKAALKNLQNHVSGIYLHIDMDVFDVGEGAANHYGASAGLKPVFMTEAISLVKRHIPLRGCGFASYDPACDPTGKFLDAGIRCIREIVSNVH
jgi:arginase